MRLTLSFLLIFLLFFFNDTATTEIYTLSLHDALPISLIHLIDNQLADIITNSWGVFGDLKNFGHVQADERAFLRSEEHTSELQSQSNLVCRLLLEKKKKTK